MIDNERTQRLLNVLQEGDRERRTTPASVDALLDAMIAVYDDCRTYAPSGDKPQSVVRFLQRYGNVVEEIRSLRVNVDDFEYVSPLAKGQFGDVSLVRGKADGKVYALKTLRKSEMLRQQDIAFFMEERHVLASMEAGKWIVTLHSAFHDETNLYLVMDFLGGGDLATLILRDGEDEFHMTEDVCRFYAAEILLALEELHKCGYMHRDLKPGNVLIGANGHIKLADFGSCIPINQGAQERLSAAVVGTPDYISPEVLRANEGNGRAIYGKECDFWSFGVVLYEMLYGDVPFYADSLVATYGHIMNHEKYFALPESPKFSDESADLLSKLICSQEKRLSDANQIKSHPFFKNIDWDHMHERTPPFLPKLESDVDTVNFFGNEEESCGMTLSGVGSKGNVNAMQRDRAFTGNQLSFVGYSFNRHVKLFHAVSPSPKSSMVMAGEVSTHMTMTSKNDGPSADDADTGVVLKSADTLDSAAEMERYSALDAKYRALEEELVLVRQEATLVKDALEKSRLAMSQQRDEKRDLSETVKDLREKLEKKSHDRNEVERAARDSIQREMAEICTEKQRMFDELAAVREELFQHQKRAASYDATIADAQRENATLAELIKSAQQQAKDVIVKKDTIEQDLLRAREQLSAANEAQESLKTKLATVEATCTSMQEQLSASENKLEIERSVSREKLATITEDKLLAELQVAELQTRCDHLTKQLDVLIADSTTKQQDSIQVELDTRNLLTEQLSQVKREKHVLEAQLNDHRETLSATEQQVIRANTQILALEEKLMNASSRNSEETYRLRKAVAEAERNKAAAVDEAEILRVKLAEHSMVREALVEAERLLAEAVQSNNTLAERLVDLEKKHDSLHAEVAHANESNRILEAKLATEQAGNDRMRKQEAESLREKTDMQSDLLVLRTKLDHLLSTQIDAEEYERLSDECNGLRQNVRDFTERYDLLQQKHRQVAEDNIELRRVHENDILERMALNRKMMESTGISPVSATSGMDFDGARKSRGTISKIKGYEQKLQQELARRTAAELELSAVRQTKLMLEKEIEDLRKASFQGDEHTRSTSILSFGGLMRRPSMDSMFKQKRTRPLLFQDALGPQLTLQGYIKIRVSRTDKPNKFDWEKRYAVVSDSRLFLYEKEKDKDSTSIEPLVDLRLNTFNVRTVAPNEMIHLSKREISCVFTVQAVISSNTSLSSLDTSGNISGHTLDASQIQKKLAAVEQTLIKEEKYKIATEKLATVSSGDAKKKTLTELDRIVLRLKDLRNEKADLERAMLEFPDVTPLTSAEIQSANPDEEIRSRLQEMDFGAELSKKESIAQGVKNLLAVTTDPATKSLLEAQLSSVKKEIQMMKRSVDNLSTPGQAPTLSMSDLSPKKLLQMMTSTYESNGHTFKVKSVAPSAACYHCHDTLYGNNQTLECKCCHLTCHKYCYTLVKETCEDHLHLHNATKWFFMANDEADRMRWVTGLDHIRANVKEEARTAAARSSTPTSHTSLSRMTSQSDSRKDEHA